MALKKLLLFIIIISTAAYLINTKGANLLSSTIDVETKILTIEEISQPIKNYIGENGTLLIVMATWCPYCNDEINTLKELNEYFLKNKIGILIAVYGDSDAESDDIYNSGIRDWIWKNDLPWNWHTAFYTKDMIKNFHIKKLTFPHFSAINKNKILTFSKAGVYEKYDVQHFTDEMLKSNEK